jgi:hypothetical protein
MTAATAQAAEAMEMLNAVPFGGLMDAAATSAGAVDAAAFSSSAGPSHTFRQDQPMQVDLDANKRVDSYAADRNVDGVGQIQIRWEVLRIDNQTRVVRVVAASSNPLLRARSRVELVTYRSCTGPRLGCPPTP